ncbi:MAG: Gfo/Idh/MocA family oxidoreductase, partial [Tannerella sp.]|nr:Gfo/Idh/MocA family oxidoreductase [Tannerella sp.]
MDDYMEKNGVSRRDFFRDMGLLGGGGMLLTAFPWLQSCRSADEKKEVARTRVRLGIVGTGSRGQYHMQNLRSLPNVEVTALCDNYAVHLEQAAAMYPSARICADYRQMLERNDVEAVLIATPPDMHAEITIAALEAGKHTFCEKSLALSLAECLAMYKAYRRTGKVLYIGQQRLFDPKYIRAIEM